jgi:hypothetical protein
MAATAQYKVVVMWEHEVRAAAKALAHLSRVYDDESSTEDQRRDALKDALKDALNAAIAALAQADDDGAALVISVLPPI